MCRFLLVLALAVSLAVVLSTAATGGAASRQAAVVGDSLALGTATYLAGDLPGWQLSTDAKVGRHLDEGLAIIAARRLPEILLVSLGTNDDPSRVSHFRAGVLTVLKRPGPRCVIWADIWRPPSGGVSYDGYNRALRDLARSYHRLRVVAWSRMAAANPQWFSADGVHPSGAGYAARAKAVAAAVRAC